MGHHLQPGILQTIFWISTGQQKSPSGTDNAGYLLLSQLRVSHSLIYFMTMVSTFREVQCTSVWLNMWTCYMHLCILRKNVSNIL